MNNVITLVKIGLISAFRGQVGKKRKINKPLIGLLLLVWLGPMVWAFSEVIEVFYNSFEAFGQGDSIIVMGLLVTSVVVFIFGIFYTIGSYYMAKDIPSYLYLPLKSWEITAARFMIVLLYEYLTMLLFFLPVVIGYGIAASQGVVFYIFAVFVFLLLPILPLALASIIIMGIMSFAKKAMNKDRFTMIASILGLGIGIGFNIGFQSLARSADNSQGMQDMIMSGRISLAENIAKYFPGLISAAKALTEADILHLLLFALISAASFAVFILAARALYFKGVIGINQQVSRREFDAEKSNGFKSGSPLKTYLQKELKLIFRTPIYFMNLAIIDFLMPIMILVPLLITLETPEVMSIKNSLMRNASGGVFVAGAFILFSFISAMNGITATTISREGRQLYIMKYIPMDYRAQMDAKLLSGMFVSMIGMLITLIVFAILLGIPFGTVVLMFLAGTNAVLMTRLTGLFIDGAHPKLNWDNEVKAVKQNMNLVFNMLIGIAAAGIAVVFLIFVSSSTLVSSLVFIAGMLAMNYGLYRLLQSRFPKMIARIE